jgi:hypothetical protein
MKTSDKRKAKVKVVQDQVAQGLHPMQDPELKVRKKVAIRIADKMISSVLEKQK